MYDCLCRVTALTFVSCTKQMSHLVKAGPQLAIYKPEEIQATFGRWSKWDNFAHDDLSAVHLFYRGYCLRCNEGDFSFCKCCKPRGYSERDRRQMTMNLCLGICKCGSAGTLGFDCLDCHNHEYQRIYLHDDPNAPYLDPQKWAEKHDHPVHVINPVKNNPIEIVPKRPSQSRLQL